MLINTNLNFKIHTDSMGLVAILFEDGVFTYFNGEEMIELGGKKELYKFLFKHHASYVDEGKNLRALVLSYEASKAALFQGHMLRDKTGSTYEFDPETGMILIDGGDVKFRQLPFAKYMLDIHRNIEMKEEEARRQLEEERQTALAAAKAPKEEGISWWKIAATAAFGGLALAGGTYLIIKK